ncbi:MAG: hypothetical protein LAN64_05850 [Acidobacteriia bacterium]|nr:hypothetical protein [Terriglobia bacterium]
MPIIGLKIELDNEGAVKGLRAFNTELDGMKTHAVAGAAGASQAMGGIDKSTQRSIDSARLLESTFGVALPRTLTKLISQSEAFGSVLSAAFNVSVVAALGAAVVVVGEKIAAAAVELGGYTKAMQDAYAANVKANNEELANPKTLEIAKQTLSRMQQQKKASDQVIASQMKEDELVQDFFDYGTRSLATAAQRAKSEEQLLKTEEARIPVGQKMNELQIQLGVAMAQAQGRVAQAKAIGPLQQIAAEESTALAVLNATYTGALRKTTMFRVLVEATQQEAAAKAAKAYQDFQVKLREMTIGGSAKLVEEGSAAIAKKVTADFVAELKNEQQASEQGLRLIDQRKQAEYDAAIAIANYNGDSVSAIALQERQRVEDTIGHLRMIGVAEQDLQALRIQLNAGANVRIAEEFRRTTQDLGSQLGSLFDDIGGGNLEKRLLTNFKKLTFEMIAQWLLATNAMRGGMGSIFSDLVFGSGSTAAQYFGGAGGMMVPGMTNAGFGPGTFGGSTTQAMQMQQWLGAQQAGQMQQWLGTQQAGQMQQWLGAQPSGTTMDQWIGAQPSGTTLSNQLLGIGGLNITRAQTGIGLFNKSTLSGAAPLMAALLGGKLGGTTGMLGAGLLTAMAIGPSAVIGGLNSVAVSLGNALGISAGAAAGLMTGVGAGLFGFGIGQQYGKLPGTISGGASGALLGLAFGGPIGAVIGGIIGLLGGLFGGLFGGSQRRKQAEQYAQAQLAEIDSLPPSRVSKSIMPPPAAN